MRNRICFILVLMLLAAACKPATQAGASIPLDAAPQTQQEPRQNANQSETTKTSATAIARKAGTTNDDRALCAVNEDVVISCSLAGENKIASLCASKGVTNQSGYVYFAQGTAGHKDYIYPADKSAPARRFKRTQLGYAGNTGGYAYSFDDGGRKHIFYSISGAYGLEDHGVMVVVDVPATPETVLACEKNSVIETESDALFKFTDSWDHDPHIDKHGLPPQAD